MPIKTLAGWLVLALLGLALAAGVTIAASRLSSQAIGISAEPLSAGDDLAVPATATPARTAAPKRATKKKAAPKRTATAAPAATRTAAPAPAAARTAEPGDDNGGSGSNSGKGSSGSGSSGSGSSHSGGSDDD
jgi:hypothetical protein